VWSLFFPSNIVTAHQDNEAVMIARKILLDGQKL
jgi:hypothetical protein